MKTMTNQTRPTMLERMAANFMAKVYERNPEWKWTEKKDGTVVVDVEHKSVAARLAQKFADKPKVTHVTFDEHGSEIWKAIDGKRNVLAIMKIMEKKYPDVDEIRDRTGNHIRTLEVNKLIRPKKASRFSK